MRQEERIKWSGMNLFLFIDLVNFMCLLLSLFFFGFRKFNRCRDWIWQQTTHSKALIKFAFTSLSLFSICFQSSFRPAWNENKIQRDEREKTEFKLGEREWKSGMRLLDFGINPANYAEWKNAAAPQMK